MMGSEGKHQVSQEGLAQHVEGMLSDIQLSLFERATRFRDENTHHVDTYEDFKNTLEEQGGFLRVHWAGTSEDEDAIKSETKATIRCFPLDPPDGRGRCFYTGEETDRIAIFARAY
jgi:prolyl-tRNA synthetase